MPKHHTTDDFPKEAVVNIGDKTLLKTTHKTTIVGAINELKDTGPTAVVNSGTTDQRPMTGVSDGQRFFDTTINCFVSYFGDRWYATGVGVVTTEFLPTPGWFYDSMIVHHRPDGGSTQTYAYICNLITDGAGGTQYTWANISLTYG